MQCNHEGIKIDLGCGRLPKSGFIGIDRIGYIDGAGFQKVDIVRDVEKVGLPFCDQSVEEIKADNVLEHLFDLIFVMNECHRVLKVQGVLYGCVPVAGSKKSFDDPTHRRFFLKSTFDYFCGEGLAKSDRPSHPRYADYEILPWIMESLEDKDELLYFKLKPRKV